MNPFKIYYPVRPLHINQGFGASNQYYQQNYGVIGHNGIDFQAYHGQPIYAAHDGFAYFETDASGGEGVIIRTADTYDYKGQQVVFKTIYWHMCDAKQEPHFASPITCTDLNSNGQPVKAGDLIGYADNTGKSTGDHLHLGLKPMTGRGGSMEFMNVEQSNGYAGAIDPTPYFNGLFAQDIQAKFIFSRNLGLYSWGTDVFQLQKRLVAEGYATFTPTGWFGGKTQQAVENYQTKRGIEATGFCGPLTRAALNT